MSDEGQRIEFGETGPYLFQVLDVEPEALLLDEHEVCLIQFEQLFLPVSVVGCAEMAAGLSNMSQADIGPEREGMIPVEFDLDEMVELPLLTGAANESFQFGDVIYIDILFDKAAARLCFSVRTAAAISQILSQVPA